MGNTKHTPGPYYYQYEPSIKKWVVFKHINVNDTDFETGETLPGMTFIVIAECENEETAKLIAAAPDLLDKLIEVKDFLKRVQGPLTPANFLLQEIDELILKATE